MFYENLPRIAYFRPKEKYFAEWAFTMLKFGGKKGCFYFDVRRERLLARFLLASDWRLKMGEETIAHDVPFFFIFQKIPCGPSKNQ